MNAEVSLKKVLQNMQPKLHDEIYIFCVLDESRLQRLWAECLCLYREQEGVSAILPQPVARRERVEMSSGFCQITLQVYSSLNAVGLTAVVAAELAEVGISANVVAALRHDHIFVPQEKAHQALQILRGISGRAQYS